MAHCGVARWPRHGIATLAGLGEPPHSQVPAPGRPNCSLQLHSSALLSGLGGHVILPPPISLLMWFQGCCCQCHLLSIWAMSSLTAVTISQDTGKVLGILRGYSYVRGHFCVTALITVSFMYVCTDLFCFQYLGCVRGGETWKKPQLPDSSPWVLLSARQRALTLPVRQNHPEGLLITALGSNLSLIQ